MALVRHVVPALIAGLCWATHLGAQDSTGAITGRVTAANKVASGVVVTVSMSGDAFAGIGLTLKTVTDDEGRFRSQLSAEAAAAGTARAAGVRLVTDLPLPCGAARDAHATDRQELSESRCPGVEERLEQFWSLARVELVTALGWER